MNRNSDSNTRLVYTSEEGRICPKCGNPVKSCICHKKKGASVFDGIARVSRETKGRKGKEVTLISGLPLDANGLKQMGRRLKSKCGSGGTIKNGVIEIQGDHRDVVVEELKKAGFTVKRGGG